MASRTGLATITEWDLDNGAPGTPVTSEDAVALTVDFDPQSLELSYTATGKTEGKENTAHGTFNKTAAQQTGQTASLSVTLLFDTSEDGARSVQDKTNPLVKLTLPRNLSGASTTRRVALFEFGSFSFAGCVDQMTQTIDMFSDTGIPLRASVHLTLSQVGSPDPAASSRPRKGAGSFGSGAGGGSGTGASFGLGGVGTAPLTLSQEGDTVQGIATRAGVSWQSLAAANGIDNPRVLPPGTVLSLSQADAG